MMKRSRDLGTFVAVARATRTGTFARRDGELEISYVEVDVELVDGLAGPADASTVRDLGRSIRWRGGYTAAAIHRTLRSLLAMGASFPDDDPTDLSGVGSRPFRACVVSVECDLEETHGTAGVHRVFVRRVLPLEGHAARRWTATEKAAETMRERSGP